MPQMTLSELLRDHGDKTLKFSTYYKYSFCFRGHGLEVYAGGDKDDIYRAEISSEMTLKKLDSEAGITGWYKGE